MVRSWFTSTVPGTLDPTRVQYFEFVRDFVYATVQKSFHVYIHNNYCPRPTIIIK
jgi:hypothetical protein